MPLKPMPPRCRRRLACSTPLLSVVAALLAACAGGDADEGRELSIVDSDDGAGADGDADDTGISTVAEYPSSICGGGETAPTWEGSDGLTLDWCIRISPEADSELPAGSSGALIAAPPLDAVPPPCGYFNLVGSIQMSEAADPVVLYCDADIDGGLRATHYSAETESLYVNMIQPQQCSAESDTGSLSRVEGGTLAWWIAPDATEEGDVEPGIFYAILDSTAGLLSEPERLYFPGWPVRLEAPAEDAAFLLIEDHENLLWSVPVAEDGNILSEPVQVAEGIRMYATVGHAGGVAASICMLDGTLQLLLIDGSGVASDLIEVAGDVCTFDSRPSIASDGSNIVVGWSDSDEGFLAWVNTSGEVSATASLGEDASYPQAAWDGIRWWSIDATGALRAWSSPGISEPPRYHPAIAAGSGTQANLRFKIDNGFAGFLSLVYDVIPVGESHIYTFYHLESSRALLPAD